MKCQLKWCKSGKEAVTRVNENIGDGSWSTWICQGCRNALGLVEGDDLPEPDIVSWKLKERYKE
jgi:hypothetical protein